MASYVPPHLRAATNQPPPVNEKQSSHGARERFSMQNEAPGKGPRTSPPRPTHFISLPCKDAHSIVQQAQQFITKASPDLKDFCEAVPVARSHVSLLMLRLTNRHMVQRANEVFMLFESAAAAEPLLCVHISGLESFHNGGVLYLNFTPESATAIYSLREALRLHFLTHYPESLFLDARQRAGDLSFIPHLTLVKKPWEERSVKWPSERPQSRVVPSQIISNLSSKIVSWVSNNSKVEINEIHLCAMHRTDGVDKEEYYYIEASLPLCD